MNSLSIVGALIFLFFISPSTSTNNPDSDYEVELIRFKDLKDVEDCLNESTASKIQEEDLNSVVRYQFASIVYQVKNMEIVSNETNFTSYHFNAGCETFYLNDSTDVEEWDYDYYCDVEREKSEINGEVSYFISIRLGAGRRKSGGSWLGETAKTKFTYISETGYFRSHGMGNGADKCYPGDYESRFLSTKEIAKKAALSFLSLAIYEGGCEVAKRNILESLKKAKLPYRSRL